MEKSTVFVVDDDPQVHASLASRLEPSGRTVQRCGTAEELLHIYDANVIGCVVTELRLRGMSGISLIEELSARGLSIPVIILTGYADSATAVRAFKAGAFDFFEKPFDHSLFVRVDDAVATHRSSNDRCREYANLRARFRRLTDRERQVMAAVVAGKANKLIAYELGLSAKTIEAHRARLMHKLNVESLAALVRIDTMARLSASLPSDEVPPVFAPILRPTGTGARWE